VRRLTSTFVAASALCALAFAILVASAAPADARPVRSLLEDRHQNVIIQKWDNSCGAAALATLLTYFKNYPVDEQTVARGLLRQTDADRVRTRGGFSLLDMKRFLAEMGWEGDGYSGLTWDDLSGYTPAVIPIKIRGYDHFVVLKDVSGSSAHIADPGFGNYTLGKGEFLRAWTNGIVFVATAGGQTNSHGSDQQGFLEGDGGDRLARLANGDLGPDRTGVAAPGR
jgi:predicted double-glycine peptidase